MPPSHCRLAKKELSSWARNDGLKDDHAQSKDLYYADAAGKPGTLLPTRKLTPRNTSPPDDAPPEPTYSAPAPAKILKSTGPPHFPPDEAAQTTSSGPPTSGTPDTQTNPSIHDTSDETNPESPPHPRPQSPTLPASSCDAVPPAPPPSPR